ncbi:Tryptophan 2,3-dioxygenase (vermilion) [Micromonospora nigra]|uniref:Tryptophan 2,3-dioxygenase (Vermilion) n=1 Tax=Micromonospora nigra TaxID=145857 RepID=A0A1C6S7N3_9ACTN|nr:Tryptophan 2,3-dioxygenase (vermilion) [Micromonospora nigra]
MHELTSWLAGAATPHTFPFTAVLDTFHRTGKHFVAGEMLALLDEARRRLPGPRPTADDDRRSLLSDFLDVALDKWDGRYDYRSYLALRLLRMPCGTDEQRPAVDDATGRRSRDRLLVRLIADALAFEMSAAERATDLLPQGRPPPAVVAKRCRLGIRAVTPALNRLGIAAVAGDGEPVSATALRTVATDLDAAGDLRLRLSMLPVHVTHDEYLFIRVLQAYECLFAGLADELRAAALALTGDAPCSAAERLGHARELLGGASPIFSLLATMQPESFRTFRQYTEGASAIQSRSYKLVESLCRAPGEDRLDSAAYRSVPEVRALVRSGQPTVDEAYRSAVRTGRLRGPDRDLVARAMDAFAEALLQWRRTHLRLAVRMLGSRPGTGYTEGTPYLAAVRELPVFTAVAPVPPPTDSTEGCPA